MNKKESRLRRARKVRAKIRQLEVPRISVFKSSNNIYAQLISACGSKVLAQASTVEKEVRANLKQAGNKDAAVVIGGLIAKRALDAGIKKVAFDRSGYKYHGRVKALADAAREGGVEF